MQSVCCFHFVFFCDSCPFFCVGRRTSCVIDFFRAFGASWYLARPVRFYFIWCRQYCTLGVALPPPPPTPSCGVLCDSSQPVSALFLSFLPLLLLYLLLICFVYYKPVAPKITAFFFLSFFPLLLRCLLLQRLRAKICRNNYSKKKTIAFLGRHPPELGHHERADRERWSLLFSRDLHARHPHGFVRLQRSVRAEAVLWRGAALPACDHQHQGNIARDEREMDSANIAGGIEGVCLFVKLLSQHRCSPQLRAEVCVHAF